VAPNILTHACKTWPLEIPSGGDKTCDSGRRPRSAFEHLPHGPPPEIHIKVFQHIFVAPVTWLFEIIGKRVAVLETIATFDPTTLSLGLIVIGRVADAHLNIGVE